MIHKFGFVFLALISFAACTRAPVASPDLSEVAEGYVRLVLAVGEHDPEYVDFYYGPAERRAEVAAEELDLPTIAKRGRALLADLGRIKPAAEDKAERLRYHFLTRQLEALVSYVGILQGDRLSFDVESRVLYDAVLPEQSKSAFAEALAELDALLPGEGALQPRLEALRKQHVVAADRVDAVFRRAIDECRRRTVEHLDLPAGESFEVEYVTGKPWGAYNWYKGSFHSLIQINTDLPFAMEMVILRAGHEGYPGHHVLNSLYEQSLVRERGWVEPTVYPLRSPESLMAEATADAGVEMIFPGNERLIFERDVLYPLAGLDPASAELYWRVRQALQKLDAAEAWIARPYLDGKFDADETVARLMEIALMDRSLAEKRLSFIDHYRSYVINYSLGQELVERHLERRAGNDPSARWREFERILTTLQVASSLDGEGTE